MHTVIYIFRSTSGRAYVGRRAVSAGALRRWPRAGRGPLPDGYCGSGKVWQAVVARHGMAGAEWRILARVTGSRDEANAVERRAVRLARAIFGPSCVNIRDGGDGWNSDEARALCAAREADPALAAKHRVKLRANADAWNQSPEGKAHITALAASWNYSPEGRAAQAKARAAAASPEARAKAEATKRRKAMAASSSAG